MIDVLKPENDALKLQVHCVEKQETTCRWTGNRTIPF